MDTTFHPSNPLPCFSGVIAPEFVLSWIQQNPSPQGLRRRCGGRFGRRFFYLCKTLTHPQLASEKAKFYEQYKEAKEELLKLKTAKQNVASFFREEEQTQQER